jgi:hypothetical protein
MSSDGAVHRADGVKAKLAEIARECGLTAEELERLQNACDVILATGNRIDQVRAHSSDAHERELKEEEYQERLGARPQVNS